MSKLLTQQLKDFLYKNGLRQTDLIFYLEKEIHVSIKKSTFSSWLSGRTPRFISEEEIFNALNQIGKKLENDYEGQWVKKEVVAQKINDWIDRGLNIKQVAIFLSVSRQHITNCRKAEHRFPAKKWRKCVNDIEHYMKQLPKS